MKHFINKSKEQILAKLKWFSSILDVVASIFKSFAMIIGSTVAITTASITGYYEAKKLIKKGKHETMALAPKPMAGEGSGTMRGPASTTTAQPSAPIEVDGYKFDMNSGAFIVSLVMIVVLLFNKFKGTPK